MNYLFTSETPKELAEVEAILKEHFDKLADKETYSFADVSFHPQQRSFSCNFDHKKDRGYSGKQLKVNLDTMVGEEIDHTVVDVRGSWRRENQRTRLFAIEIDDEIRENIKNILPVASENQPDQPIILKTEPVLDEEDDDLDEFPEYQLEDEDDVEKHSCGGTVIPMYDEHPHWIKLCKQCGDQWEEEGSVSPLPY
jgi:hypothetical protein